MGSTNGECRMQEKIVRGKSLNLTFFERVLDQKRSLMWKGSDDSEGFYSFYGCLKEYLQQLGHFLVETAGLIEKRLSYTSIDRPGLIAEISGILVQHGFNIMDVSIRLAAELK
jgi:hypothetical protein